MATTNICIWSTSLLLLHHCHSHGTRLSTSCFSFPFVLLLQPGNQATSDMTSGRDVGTSPALSACACCFVCLYSPPTSCHPHSSNCPFPAALLDTPSFISSLCSRVSWSLEFSYLLRLIYFFLRCTRSNKCNDSDLIAAALGGSSCCRLASAATSSRPLLSIVGEPLFCSVLIVHQWGQLLQGKDERSNSFCSGSYGCTVIHVGTHGTPLGMGRVYRHEAS